MTVPTKKKVSTKKTDVKKANINKKTASKKITVKKKATASATDTQTANQQTSENMTIKHEKKPVSDETADVKQKDNIFVLNSNLTINQAALFHKTLSELAESGETVTFDASGVDMIDTAIFQLLLVFVLTIKSNGISLGWLQPSDVFRERADILGLTEALCLAEVGT